MLMAARVPGTDVFPLVDERHPFFLPLYDFRSQLAAHPAYEAVRRHYEDSQPITVRAQMSGRRDPDGVWRLRGLYASYQYQDAALPYGFAARTFIYSARHSLTCHEFPNDPRLASPALALHDADPATTRVLRYVPRRRATLALNRRGESVVAKILRPGEAGNAYARLQQVVAAVGRSPVGFGLAQPVALDELAGAYFQTLADGHPLESLIDAENFRSLLQAAGALHREVHCVDRRGFSLWNPDQHLQQTLERIDWIALFLPEERERLERARKTLLASVPPLAPRTWTFCHGDFRTTQILADPGCWTVVDFDDALRGDPYLEMGRFLAFLKYDVALLRNAVQDPTAAWDDLLREAELAYLSGYAAQAGEALDARRLTWHWLCAEIAYLAQLLRRDGATRRMLARGMQRMQELVQRLAGGDEPVSGSPT